MRDEASLRRLAEMGVDVYLPRAAMRAAVALPSGVAEASVVLASTRQAVSTHPTTSFAKESIRSAEVLLLTDVESPVAGKLLADVARALRFARVACTSAHARDESAIGSALGLVMFGDAQARAVGALLPANRQSEIGWVVGSGLAALAVDAHAKRALWSELRRMTRSIAQIRQRTLAADAAGGDHRGH
ncbi:MAG: hypothetical protein ABIO49_16290 [Dokdonella sp.]